MSGKGRTHQEVGKVFEEQFRVLLKDLHQRLRSNYHRFYDTHSAGTFLPQQPADFLLGFQGVMHFFELKSSEKHQTLASGLASLMDKEQAANLRLWARAGACVHVLFLSQEDGVVEWWDGLSVSVSRAAGKPIKPDRICQRFPNFAAFARYLEDTLKLCPNYSITRYAGA